MLKLLGLSAAAAALIALAGCGSAPTPPPVASAETEIRVAQGEMVGFKAPNGAKVWLGVPFAAPPVGDLRWRAPRPAPAWKGRREALTHGSRCLQLATGFDRDEGFEPGEAIGSEDCLTLDIYAPDAAGTEPLPVMFWIHGGGNVWGRSSQFDGAMLAEQQKVVVVAAQYRLGPLGWFAHPALREDAKNGAPGDAAANFALLDLISGLEWVRDNIASVGGDPGLVTIFGESAGGRNVAALLASPKAEGLFHRAIIQSGGMESVSLAVAEGTEGGAKNASADIAATLKAPSARALRATPGALLLQAYGGGPGFFQIPQLIRDGATLPEDGPERLLEDGGLHRVPVMIGTTRDEAKLFMAFDPRLVERRLWLFPVPRDQEFYDAQAAFISRFWRLTGVDLPAQAMRRAGREAVFAYRFDWDDGGSAFWTETSKLLGAGHALELPFLFNDFSQLGSIAKTLYQEDTQREREALAIKMGRAWAQFAKTGVPGGQGLPDWPTYGEDARFLTLDSQSDGGVRAAQGAETAERIIGDLKANAKLSAAQKCAIVAGMKPWRFTAPYQRKAAESLGCATDLAKR